MVSYSPKTNHDVLWSVSGTSVFSLLSLWPPNVPPFFTSAAEVQWFPTPELK